MSGAHTLDRVHHFIMTRMTQTGQAPFYTEIAAELGCGVEEGRKAMHHMLDKALAAWVFPDTDLIASFAPFSNLPTQYRISVDGESKWFGQWGLESLAVSWLFPGKTVRIDAPGLDSGEPLSVTLRDGKIVGREPAGVCVFVSVPFTKWMDRLPFSWSNMNLFRSEESVRGWSRFEKDAEGGIIALDDAMEVMSGPTFRRRLDQDYMANQGYLPEFMKDMARMGAKYPYLSPSGN